MAKTHAQQASDAEFQKLLETVWRRIDRPELVRLTQEFVRIPSVYRPEEAEGNEERVARFVANYLEREGFEVHMEEVAPGRPNVWAVWEGERPGKTLLFEAHTDVVTEGRAEDWSHPPFAAERVGDRIYGRGACDTKGNLAAAVMAVRAIKDSGIVTTGAGDREIPHHTDEWVSVDELFTTCKLYAATAMYFCHGKDAHV